MINQNSWTYIWYDPKEVLPLVLTCSRLNTSTQSPENEATNLLVRADLMIEIDRFIREKKMSQRKAAKFFGVHQPRINDLMNSRIEKFSIDMLLNMLQIAGKRVRIQVEGATQR